MPRTCSSAIASVLATPMSASGSSLASTVGRILDHGELEVLDHLVGEEALAHLSRLLLCGCAVGGVEGDVDALADADGGHAREAQ